MLLFVIRNGFVVESIEVVDGALLVGAGRCLDDYGVLREVVLEDGILNGALGRSRYYFAGIRFLLLFD